MRMNRRNVLVGLGGIVASGGALLGTGAFSQVEATRDVTVSTAGDDSALLQLSDGGSSFATISEGTIEISQDSLNQNAVTTVDGAIEVTNNGNNDVGFWVSGTGGSVFTIEQNDSSIEGEGSSVDLDSDNTITLDLVFDLTSGSADDIPGSITFHADQAQHSTAGTSP